jgi:hypothetical protein
LTRLPGVKFFFDPLALLPIGVFISTRYDYGDMSPPSSSVFSSVLFCCTCR